MTAEDVTPCPASNSLEVEKSLSEPDRRDELGAYRQRVDEFDRIIIEALGARAAVSRLAQATRVSRGGTRVDLNRELQIIAKYRAELGSEGAELADAILRTCRGRVTDGRSRG